MGGEDGLLRQAAALSLPAVRRTSRPLPPRGRRRRRAAAARTPARPHRGNVRPAAAVVSAIRGRGLGRVPAPRHHPEACRDVSCVGFAERVAPPDPR